MFFYFPIFSIAKFGYIILWMDCHSYYITKLEKKKEKEKKKVYLYLEDNENEKVHVREEHQLSLVQA
jgi:hypothetical protein